MSAAGSEPSELEPPAGKGPEEPKRRPPGPEEAPPPKENPWGRRRAAPRSPSPSAAAPLHAELQNFAKVIKAGRPKPRKPSKTSDFRDITNWPTPSEIANNECKVNQNKKPPNRKEKEEKHEKRASNEIKETLEVKPGGLGENVSEDEAQCNSQRKKGNKQKWVPLNLDDVKPDSPERPGSQNSSKSQPETNKLATPTNRRTETRSWRRDREKRDDHDEVSSVRMNYEYSYGHQELYGERTDQAFQPELNTSMMYYYDDGTGVQMYSVDETLLKEYIKRQI
ncbi:la-related protein 1B isoform C [Alligator mississippiensis]|nr:la-related protein 1B isoform C [Alligator mississippiensis]